MYKHTIISILYTILISGIALAQDHQIKISTTKDKYLHYELVQIIAEVVPVSVDKIPLPDTIKVQICRDEIPVITIGQINEVVLRYNPSSKIWEGKWPIPWNAPVDNYTVKVDTSQVRNLIPMKCQFKVTSRKPPKIKSENYILTVESGSDISSIRIPSPAGKEGDWRQIIEWAKFIGADTIWYLGGQTVRWKETVDEDFPWNKNNFAFLPKLAEEAHRSGLKFGVWISGYLTFGKKEYRVNKYTYAWNYDEESEKCIPTSRTISLGDKKRKEDIIKFIQEVSAIPKVDYIGIDYIRNVFGGYEMVDEFISEMTPDLPSGWSLYSQKERMKWLAQKTIKRDDIKLIDQWNWWRAHYVAQILNDIVQESKIKQPLWVFTLSWEKGWQHGQDPIMMNDAGADIDAVMLYEADNWQFEQILKEWHNYVKAGQVNLIVGNQVDWVVHQSSLNPAGPEVFYNRLVSGSTQIYQNSLAKGIFWHDLIRAIKGRKGPYPTLEWAVAGGAAFSQLRLKSSTISLCATLTVPEKINANEIFEALVTVTNLGDKKIEEVNVELLATDGISFIEENKKTIPIIEGKSKADIKFTLKINNVSKLRDSRYMVAVVTNWLEEEIPKKYFSFGYVQTNTQKN